MHKDWRPWYDACQNHLLEHKQVVYSAHTTHHSARCSRTLFSWDFFFLMRPQSQNDKALEIKWRKIKHGTKGLFWSESGVEEWPALK